jgi:CheY-like chemotaxis protein
VETSRASAKILLIDDDLDFIEATETVLRSKSNYEVITATDGNTGLHKAKQEKPDLILLDIIMPVEDGFTAAKKLKADPELQDIPVVLLTSFSQRVGETNLAVSQGLDLDVEDYLEKPIQPQDLLQKVERVLQR